MPGFDSDMVVFRVHRKILMQGTRLGKGENNPGSFIVTHYPITQEPQGNMEAETRGYVTAHISNTKNNNGNVESMNLNIE